MQFGAELCGCVSHSLPWVLCQSSIRLDHAPPLSTSSFVGLTGLPARDSSSNCFLVLLKSICAIEKLYAEDKAWPS